MHAYLVALADHFDLRRHIRFNSRLLRLERPSDDGTSTGASGWNIRTVRCAAYFADIWHLSVARSSVRALLADASSGLQRVTVASVFV